MTAPARAALAALFAAPLLTGCATPSLLCVLPPGPNEVTLVAAPDANENSAVAVDLVFLTDKLTAQQVAGLSAAEYFARRPQLERDFATGMTVRTWEIAPGQIVRNAPTGAGCNRVQTLLFARYQAPGEHRQTLAGTSAITITLNAQDFAVSP
jgi:type VI secretion system protein